MAGSGHTGFNSILTRITALMLVVIVVAVAVIGATSVVTIAAKSDEVAEDTLNVSCENEALRIDGTLTSIESSVELEASYAVDQMDSVERFLDDEAYRRQYTEDVEELFTDIAQRTNGAVSYYFRYNADLVHSTQGFLYGRDTVDSDFGRIELTDLSLYDPDDEEHVGWYYIPLRNGEPTWLDPYQNKNLGIYMISYVVPVFCDGVFIGVVGMDVNFQVIVNQLETIHPYGNGYAAITGRDGAIVYHPDIEYGARLDGTDSRYPNVVRLMNGERSGDGLVAVEYRGTDKLLAYSTLQNGMRLELVVDAGSIGADRDRLVRNLVLAATAVALLAIVIAVSAGRRMFRPLRDLTEAASEVAEGNLDVEIPSSKVVEVSTLIDAYRTTVDRMRDQLELIEGLAHQDSLTGFMNKAAYDEAKDRLNRQIDCGEANFALVMIDVNDLKLVNDTYGHERGDDYLRSATALIRGVFEGCEVFRIGGDEFVVLVEGAQALVKLDGWVARLDASAASPREMAGNPEPWKLVSVAYGVAAFDPGTDHDFHYVFSRADVAMYNKKKAMKRS